MERISLRVIELDTHSEYREYDSCVNLVTDCAQPSEWTLVRAIQRPATKILSDTRCTQCGECVHNNFKTDAWRSRTPALDYLETVDEFESGFAEGTDSNTAVENPVDAFVEAVEDAVGLTVEEPSRRSESESISISVSVSDAEMDSDSDSGVVYRPKLDTSTSPDSVWIVVVDLFNDQSPQKTMFAFGTSKEAWSKAHILAKNIVTHAGGSKEDKHTLLKNNTIRVVQVKLDGKAICIQDL